MAKAQTALKADEAGCDSFTTRNSTGTSGAVVVEGKVPRLIERFTSLSLRPEDGWHTADGRPATSKSEGALRRIGLDEYEVYLAGKVRRVRTQYESEAAHLLQRMEREQEALETLKRSASRKGDGSRRSWRRQLRAQQQPPHNGDGGILSNGQLQGLETGAGDGRAAPGSSSEVSGASSDYEDELDEDWSEGEDGSVKCEGHQRGPSTRADQQQQHEPRDASSSPGGGAGRRHTQQQQQQQRSSDGLAADDVGSSTSNDLVEPVGGSSGGGTRGGGTSSSQAPGSSGSGPQEILRVALSSANPLAAAATPSGPLSPSKSSPLPSSSNSSSSGSHARHLGHHHHRPTLSSERYVSLVGRPAVAPGQRHASPPKPSPQKEVLVKQPAPFDPLASNSLYEDPLRQLLFPLAPPGAADNDSDSE